MIVEEAIAKNLKRLLAENNMTQKKLSELSGVTIETIRGYLYCRYAPTAIKLYHIAKAFGVPISDLFEGCDE